jgi:hypothetical protein
MSRSQPTQSLVNPAVKYIEWDGENTQFKYWDKDKKENKYLKLPISFYVLDELTTIKKDFNSKYSFLWSNEVKYLSKQPLKVQAKDKNGKIFVLAEGLYGNKDNPGISEAIEAAGGKYTRSLYAAMLNDKDEYELVNFQLKGGSLGGWINFRDNLKLKYDEIPEGHIIVNTFEKEKQGKVTYNVPTFEMETASEEGNEAAIKLDIELQAFLVKYFEKTQNTQEVEYVEDKVATEKDEDNDLPF